MGSRAAEESELAWLAKGDWGAEDLLKDNGDSLGLALAQHLLDALSNARPMRRRPGRRGRGRGLPTTPPVSDVRVLF